MKKGRESDRITHDDAPYPIEVAERPKIIFSGRSSSARSAEIIRRSRTTAVADRPPPGLAALCLSRPADDGTSQSRLDVKARTTRRHELPPSRHEPISSSDAPQRMPVDSSSPEATDTSFAAEWCYDPATTAIAPQPLMTASETPTTLDSQHAVADICCEDSSPFSERRPNPSQNPHPASCSR